MALPRTWSLPGDYYIPLRLQLLTRMIERELNRAMQASVNISVAEWRVLALTCTNGKSSAAEVIQAYEADRAQVSRAVASLLEAGLVERRAAAGNGRRKDITASPRGREVFETVHRMRQAYFAAILRDFGPEDLRSFDAMLGLIAQRVDEQRTPGEAAGAQELSFGDR